MEKGDRFDIDGYDVVAHAGVMMGGGPTGDVVVLSNNSTHYIVATRESAEAPRATFVNSYAYDESYFAAYEAALALMLRIVQTN